MFEINTIIIYSLSVCLAIATVVEVIHYLLIDTSILQYEYKQKHSKKHNPSSDSAVKTTGTSALPGVSVIIYARYDAENICNFLPLVLEQQYPDYEVILVNDGRMDEETSLAVLTLQKQYPRLYTTHIPDETKIISHKKLAITIGVKAARNDILIFTDTGCRPYTPHWIEELVKTYTPETDIVLGYGACLQYKNSFVSKMIALDTLVTAMKYIGIASHIQPYMGVGRNMSYRKSFFMDNKGFAGHLHVAFGDDALFINHFATRKNTAVQPSLVAKTITIPKISFANWYFQKLHLLLYTYTNYTRQSKWVISVEPLARCIFWLSSVLLLTLFHSSAYLLIATITTVFLKLLVQTVIINKTSHYYKESGFNPILIMMYDIILPIINLYIMTIGRLTTTKAKSI